MRAEENDEPRIGAPLPGADRAVIDEAKLRLYALNTDHPSGRHKAAVFDRALGIRAEHWEYLRDCLLSELPTAPVSGRRDSPAPSGVTTWEVLLPVKGIGRHSGRTLQVLTAWSMIGKSPVLVSLRVAAQRRQQG